MATAPNCKRSSTSSLPALSPEDTERSAAVVQAVLGLRADGVRADI
jgi:hypothetical protein